MDDDNDGLIEINNATEMGFIQFNLAGTSLDDEADDSGANGGDTRGAQTFSNHTATTTVLAGLGAKAFTYTTAKHPCAPNIATLINNSGPSATNRTVSLGINNVTKTFTCSRPGGIVPIGFAYAEIVNNNVNIKCSDTTNSWDSDNSHPLSDFNANNPLCGYELNADVDLPNTWTPIGTTANRFTGIFDGNNKIVRNLSGAAGAERRIFGDISANTIVRNIQLRGTGITNANKNDIAVDNINGGTVTGIVIAP